MDFALLLLNLMFGIWGVTTYVADPEGFISTWLLVTSCVNFVVAGALTTKVFFGDYDV